MPIVDSTATADPFLGAPPYVPDCPQGVLGLYDQPPLASAGVLDPLAKAAAAPAAAAAVEVEAGDAGDTTSPMYYAHMRKECTPCNYFYYKTDGCREGKDCQFCHLCPKGEIKKRKKERVKFWKAQNENAQLLSYLIE